MHTQSNHHIMGWCTNVSPDILNSSELILWLLIPSVDPKHYHTGMAFLHEEKDDQMKRRNKAQRADKLRNLKRHIPWVIL